MRGLFVLSRASEFRRENFDFGRSDWLTRATGVSSFTGTPSSRSGLHHKLTSTETASFSGGNFM